MHRKLKLGPKEGKKMYLPVNIQVAFSINLWSGASLNAMHNLYFGLRLLGFLESSMLFKDLEL